MGTNICVEMCAQRTDALEPGLVEQALGNPPHQLTGSPVAARAVGGATSVNPSEVSMWN